MNGSRKYWNKFEKSGKLEDYLSFCEQRRKETSPLPLKRTDAEASKPLPPQSSL